MADDADTQVAEDTSDGLERTIRQYEQSDDAAAASDDDANEDQDDDSDDTDDTDDDSDDDTSDDDSGNDADSDDDDDDAADDDADDQDDAESDDDADADADDDSEEGDEPEGDQDDEGDEVSDETRKTLEARGADLSLKDVPKKFRPVVQAALDKKLKGMDAAFTRRMQEFGLSRKELNTLRTESRYQSENPDLLIVELLRKGGQKLMDKVNARINKLDPEADGADETAIKDYSDALDETIKGKRNSAREAVETAANAEVQLQERSAAIETYARGAARKLGIPFSRMLDRALASEIRLKPQDQWAKGLSEEEIDAVVQDYAREFHGQRRAGLRNQSREQVRNRSKDRARNTKRPARQSAVNASPGPSRQRREKSSGDDSKDFLKGGMRLARRLYPGAPDE